jgi:NitT/TauT family transport system permease protein
MIADAVRKLGGAVDVFRGVDLIKGRLRRLSLSFLGIVLFFVAWEGTTAVLGVSPRYLPGPLDVYGELVRIWEPLLTVLPNTLTAAGVGFVVSVVLSIVVAMPIVASERIGNAMMPFIVGMNTVPRIAVTPLVIYWVGFIEFLDIQAANYVMAVWVAFFPMLIAAIDGFRSIDEATENMLEVYGARTWQEFRYVRLQSGLPFIFDGMKLGFILAMIGAVIGEFISGSLGIGAMAKSVIAQTAVGRAIAIVLVLGLISSVVVFLVYLVESRVVHWRESSIVGER